MKKELLAPAGNFDTLKQAIHNGCDAVYLGGKKFGARKFASNFDSEEMIEAIKYCHLYGVKIYVTVNTLIYEDEMDEVLEYIKFLHSNHVDALIMQDIGLITRVRRIFPELEIHASTQLHTHNQKQIELLEKLGVKRVVVARELSIDEINKLDTSLEIEAFIHGALCICYSGQCLFSSLLLNRSGNRGECAGICRLPFSLYEEDKMIETEGKFLLSPKELNTLEHIQELMESNITSFKIEGRMKNPTTIGFITRLYRTLIDHYEKKHDFKLSEDEIQNLKVLFNREFTSGYLFNNYGKDLMNIKSPNHVGIEIGTVLDVSKDKIKIKLRRELSQEDGIRFVESDKGMIANFIYNEKGLLINHGEVGQTIVLDNKIGLTNKDRVAKTIDSKLIKTLEAYPQKKIAIKMSVKACLDSFYLEITDGAYDIELEKNIVQRAINTSTTKERIKEQLEKLGDTPFYLESLELEVEDGLFIPIKEINEIRREAILKLINLRENSGPIYKEVNNELPDIELPHQKEINLNVLVRSEEQLKACLAENINTIYVTDDSLYQKYKDLDNIYLRLDRVKKNHSNYTNERLLITETGSIYYGKNNEVVTDYYLNVANSDFIRYLVLNDIKRITASVEIATTHLQNLKKYLPDLSILEVIVYGRIEVMITKYCPLNMLINKNKFPCNICRNGKQYYLMDRNNEKYPLIQSNELTHILNYKNLESADLDDYLKMGIKNYRLELWNEDYDSTIKVIKKYRNRLS